MSWLLVSLGSGLGGLLRALLDSAAVQLFGAKALWGILTANLVGCFAAGLLAGLIRDPASPWRSFMVIGVLGGFTTFSTFSVQAVDLAHRGHWGQAALYAGGSLVGCLLACAAGFLLTQADRR